MYLNKFHIVWWCKCNASKRIVRVPIEMNLNILPGALWRFRFGQNDVQIAFINGWLHFVRCVNGKGSKLNAALSLFKAFPVPPNGYSHFDRVKNSIEITFGSFNSRKCWSWHASDRLSTINAITFVTIAVFFFSSSNFVVRNS